MKLLPISKEAARAVYAAYAAAAKAAHTAAAYAHAAAVYIARDADEEAAGDAEIETACAYADALLDAYALARVAADAAYAVYAVAVRAEVAFIREGAHVLMRAGVVRDEARAMRLAAEVVLTAQTGDRYDQDFDRLTPQQNARLAALAAFPEVA